MAATLILPTEDTTGEKANKDSLVQITVTPNMMQAMVPAIIPLAFPDIVNRGIRLDFVDETLGLTLQIAVK